ncbi:hypothetical protein A5792_20450 [Mycolicibacterium peregrinum]|uniref:Uncharacterized protein n=1 Tax=Mycolicibacterium peregrinum TaxID=43304 RepID=A0A1A0R4U9_MYCPR|nr:hypothetical protein [Mycolicibacterium peregrinum]OBB29173.1 hypothetical protein A5792_20450 [Mycolicibacterium peregrinum]
MNDNRISATPALTPRRAPAPRHPSIRARLTARIRSGRLDAMLAVGVPTPHGSAIAARAARLTSISEREAIARVLRRCVHESANDTIVWSSRIPLHRKNIAAAETTIDAITLRLHSPLPVNARGMARLNRVINDGLGPLYAYGHGDLDGRLGAALAAL